MTPGAAIAAAARGYLETPFRHQGRLPGVGLDCAGVVVCAARAAGLTIEDAAGYAPSPDPARFAATLAVNADRIGVADARPGDVVTFAFLRHPQHLAIVSAVAPLRIVHAWIAAGRVVETGVDAYWRRRLRDAWRLRGVA